MFSLCFLLSVYIPFELEYDRSVSNLNEEGLNESMKANKTIIALGITKKQASARLIPAAFSNASAYFHGMAEFAFISEEVSRPLAKKLKIDLPILLFCQNQSIRGIFTYPESETSLLFLIRSLLSALGEPVNSTSGLFSRIGSFPFSIICEPSICETAMRIQRNSSAIVGLADVIPAEQGFITSLFDDSAKMALFRKEDLTITAFFPEFDSYVDATAPVYRNLGVADLSQDESIIVALVAPKLTEAQREFLYEIGSRFPDYIVGFLGARNRAVAEEVIGHRFNDSTYLAVFNRELGLHFPTSDYINQSQFCADEWINSTIRLLEAIDESRVMPIYNSEEVPTEQKSPMMQIVGKTYEQFVMDDKKDIVVLYYREGCPHCVKMKNTFEDFANECNKSGVGSVSFGIIEITKNSARLRFPYMIGVPHVHIFPAKNKSENDELRGGRDRDALIRLINSRGSTHLPFKEPELDKEMVGKELIHLSYSKSRLPEIEARKAERYIIEMAKLIQFNYSALAGGSPEPKTDEL